MIWTAIGVALVVVIIGWLVLRASGREQARIDDSKARAVPATARIVSVVGNGSSHRDTSGVASGHDVTLDVTVPGHEPFRVTVPFAVRPMAVPAVQVGCEVAVRVDLRDLALVYPDDPDILPDRHAVVQALGRAAASSS